MYASPAKVRPVDDKRSEREEPLPPSSSKTNLQSLSRRHETSARQWELKETMRCMFCRGKRCKRCGESAYLHATEPSFHKFHCNWITEEILGMQRPADELFDSINLLDQFNSNGITAVVNLCEPGEHPFCGFGLKPSGFPYSPERLMNAGIKHLNFSWRDMTAPSLSTTQNIVRVCLAELLGGGKVAIHCHAGFGRTGIVVACLMIARSGVSAADAVALVRRKRPGSVQTSTQLAFVQQFEKHYAHQSCVFPFASRPSSTPHDDGTPRMKTIDMSVEDELLCKLEADSYDRTGQHYRHLSLVPKTIRITSALLCRAMKQSELSAGVGTALGGVVGSLTPQVPDDYISRLQVSANNGQWSEWSVLRPESNEICVESVVVCSALTLDWLESRSNGVFTSKSLIELHSLIREELGKATDSELNFSMWHCSVQNIQDGHSVGGVGKEDAHQVLADLSERVDAVLRACLSRYQLVLLDVLVQILSGVYTSSSSAAGSQALPPPSVTYSTVRLAIACCPAHTREELRKLLLVEGTRVLSTDALDAFVNKNILQYGETTPPTNGNHEGTASLQCLHSLVLVMNVFQLLVTFKWSFLRNSQVRVQWMSEAS